MDVLSLEFPKNEDNYIHIIVTENAFYLEIDGRLCQVSLLRLLILLLENDKDKIDEFKRGLV
jgi:hypothetical protein